VAQVTKPCLAFAPALKAFDTGLLKVGFTGKTATDAAAIVRTNKQLIVVMTSVRSAKSFEASASPLFAEIFALQKAFAGDLGISPGDLYI
jgi:hypothetical protein